MTLVNVPQAAPVQPTPDSDHVTPLFCVSFCNCAVNGAVNETCTKAEAGRTATEIGAGAEVMVIVEEPDFVVSATEVAVKVTVAGFGAVAGAL